MASAPRSARGSVSMARTAGRMVGGIVHIAGVTVPGAVQAADAAGPLARAPARVQDRDVRIATSPRAPGAIRHVVASRLDPEKVPSGPRMRSRSIQDHCSSSVRLAVQDICPCRSRIDLEGTPMMRPIRTVILSLIVVAVAACGSTVSATTSQPHRRPDSAAEPCPRLPPRPPPRPPRRRRSRPSRVKVKEIEPLRVEGHRPDLAQGWQGDLHDL